MAITIIEHMFDHKGYPKMSELTEMSDLQGTCSLEMIRRMDGVRLTYRPLVAA
jgi:hypothetical protein